MKDPEYEVESPAEDSSGPDLREEGILTFTRGGWEVSAKCTFPDAGTRLTALGESGRWVDHGGQVYLI